MIRPSNPVSTIPLDSVPCLTYYPNPCRMRRAPSTRRAFSIMSVPPPAQGALSGKRAANPPVRSGCDDSFAPISSLTVTFSTGSVFRASVAVHRESPRVVPLPVCRRFSGPVRLLSLVLVCAIGLQGVPIQSVLQHVHTSAAHHQCNHPAGYCPMNPDGPCTCDHTSPDRPEEPTLRSCSGVPTDGLTATTVSKWIVDRVAHTIHPRERTTRRTPVVSLLSSQRCGDRIFHPPRLPAEDRSGRPLPVPGHS